MQFFDFGHGYATSGEDFQFPELFFVSALLNQTAQLNCCECYDPEHQMCHHLRRTSHSYESAPVVIFQV
jgi:hypothetical protein